MAPGWCPPGTESDFERTNHVSESAVSERNAPSRTSRRALLGAGTLGAVAALIHSQRASAAADQTATMQFAISLELTARDLYRSAIDAGAQGDLWQIMADQHQAYAERLAGIANLSADQRNDEAFEALEGAFRSETTTAGLQLENIAAATHADLLSTVENDSAAAAIASIASMESRHATLLASFGGSTDPDVLFINDATPLSPEG